MIDAVTHLGAVADLNVGPDVRVPMALGAYAPPAKRDQVFIALLRNYSKIAVDRVCTDI